MLQLSAMICFAFSALHLCVMCVLLLAADACVGSFRNCDTLMVHDYVGQLHASYLPHCVGTVTTVLLSGDTVCWH